MAKVKTDDGIELYYEETGSGTPLVFVHEFAGDLRSFEAQVRHFAKRYRCITYNARGYPPSDVPEDPDAYSQDRARDDIAAVMDGLGIGHAHVVGVSMGAFATLHFGLRYPERALSLCLGGCGYGAAHAVREQFAKEAYAFAARIENEGMKTIAKVYGTGPTRVQYESKDPRGFAEFLQMLAGHSDVGSANTLRGVQSRRTSLYDLDKELRALTVPMLVTAGDEDEPCLDASLYLKRAVPSAGLVFFPKTGHALNQEEPDLFNQLLGDFLHQVECGRWTLRDPRSVSAAILSRD